MLPFHSTVRRAASNTNLSEAWRFVAQRQAELLDPTAPFIFSAAFEVSSKRAVGELERIGRDFVAAGKFPHKGEVESVATYTADVLSRDANLVRLHRREQHAALTELRQYRQESQSTGSTATQLRSRMSSRVLPAAQRVLAAINGGSGAKSLRDELVDTVINAAAASQLSTADWRRLDRDLTMLCALLLDEGRDGYSLAQLLATAIGEARDVVTAGQSVRVALAGGPEEYQVALVLTGAETLESAALSKALLLQLGDGWPASDVAEPAHSRLRRFAEPHLRRSHAQVLVVPTRALDAGTARRAATRVVEEIRDGLFARHFAGTFAVEDDALALRVATGDVGSVRSAPRTVPVGAMNEYEDHLRPSLRYYALARAELVPLVSAVHAFIALEQLAVGASRVAANGNTVAIDKGSFLPPRIASVAQLCGMKRLLEASLSVFLEALRHGPDRHRGLELIRWLGGPSSGSPSPAMLDQWATVLVASPANGVPGELVPTDAPADASALVDALASGTTPFVSQRVKVARQLWTDRSGLMTFVRNHGRRAMFHTDQARIARNRTVHEGLAELDGDEQLALTGWQLLDAVFDVLPGWNPGGKAWLALDALNREARVRRTAWGRNAPIVPSAMTRP